MFTNTWRSTTIIHERLYVLIDLILFYYNRIDGFVKSELSRFVCIYVGWRDHRIQFWKCVGRCGLIQYLRWPPWSPFWLFSPTKKCFKSGQWFQKRSKGPWEVLSSLCVRLRRLYFSHYDLQNRWANWNQKFIQWSTTTFMFCSNRNGPCTRCWKLCFLYFQF